MNQSQIRHYDMLVRVRDFGTEHADLFPESSVARETFSAVGEAVRQLNAHTVSKLKAAKGTTTKAGARANLHDRLVAIERTARVIAQRTPGLEEKFLLPDVPSDHALLMTARVFAGDAAPLKEQFITHLLPDTFLTDLADAIRQFEEAMHDCEAGRDARVVARNRITAAITAGITAARALDALVANRLLDQPDTITVWKRARRVYYPSRARTASVAPTEGSPTPADAGATSAQAAGSVTPTAELVSTNSGR